MYLKALFRLYGGYIKAPLRLYNFVLNFFLMFFFVVTGGQVYFPVFVEGANLSMGDMHFSQGIVCRNSALIAP